MTILVNDKNRAFAEKLKLERAKEKALLGEALVEAFGKAIRHSALPSEDNTRIFAMAELADAFNYAVNQVLIDSRVVTRGHYD